MPAASAAVAGSAINPYVVYKILHISISFRPGPVLPGQIPGFLLYGPAARVSAIRLLRPAKKQNAKIVKFGLT
jgi:hypothetical protein